MTKIIWMTDPHFQNEGTVFGVNPRTRLQAALDHANTHHPDAAFIVMTGDLVGDEVEDDYPAIAKVFASSALPVHAIPGNHEDRPVFLSQLPLPDTAMDGFAQFSLSTPDGILLCLDTHKPGSSAGELCRARSTWLADQLTAAGDTPAYIFMHHPPMALGLPMQDAIILEEGEAFLDLVTGAGNLRYLFMGHVHRPVSGVVRGVPFSALGSLTFQAPAPQPAWDWDMFSPPQEAPHYAVVTLSTGDVRVQFTQFCDYGLGVEG